MKNRPNWLDWIIYSIFRWWWNPIFNAKPEMAKGFYQLIGMKLLDDKGEIVTVPNPIWWVGDNNER